jgi:hypothetical protein
LYGYNETVAHEQFPLTKSQAKSLWFAWHDEQTTDYSGLQTIDPTTLPQNIHEISDTILQQVLVCHKTRKPYRITKQELNLYRRLDISIPILHPDVRHSQRVAQRPPRILHWRACDESWQEIISVYTRNTPFPVYCEDEYKKIMFG